MIRIAIAKTGKSKRVADYLPNNYRVIGRTLDNKGTVIVGEDDHGWTLDDYVIPRLGTALIACEEVEEIDGWPVPYDTRRPGRKRALSDHDVEHIRHVWKKNDEEWQRYRSNPSFHSEPTNLTLNDLAVRYRVSPGVIANVIDRKGAYR